MSEQSMLTLLSDGAALLQQARDALLGDRPPLTDTEREEISAHLAAVADVEQDTTDV